MANLDSRRRQRYLELAAAVRDHPMSFIGHEDLINLAGLEPGNLNYARWLARQLVRNKVAVRVWKGVYLPNRPSERGPWFGALILQLTSGGFVSHGSAMRLHLGTWTPAVGEVQVTTANVARPIVIPPGVRLVRLHSGVGWEHPRVRLEAPDVGWVEAADSLSTALDGLEAPQFCGDFLEVVRFIARMRRTWTPEALAELADRAPEGSLSRLGYLLERIGVPLPDQMQKLERAAKRQYVRLDLGGAEEGELEPRWRVRVNVDTAALRSCFAGK